jgi:MoaA/NifB/PqqE/SkfB family radical SAM enzyme
MTEPVFLSPYLRPVLEGGELLYDNGITEGRERLAPLEHQVVRALWDPIAGPLDLQQLYGQHGRDAVRQSLEALRRKWMIFSSREQCDQALDTAMGVNVPEPPFVDQVELTNACPMSCGFCPRGVPGRVTRPIGFMDFGLFQRLLGELNPWQARYRMIELHHLGESLLHPELTRFVAAASERGIPTELAVNPSLLRPDLAKSLLGAGLRRLVVAIDGVDEATLAAIRGPKARYRDAERNLLVLLEELAKQREPMKLVIQMLELERNRSQRDAFLERWGRLGLPYVEAYVKKLDGPDPDTAEKHPEPESYLCNYPWRSVVVLWDGRVVPCCRDHDAALVLGDLQRQSLREVWRGDVVRQLRLTHRSGECAPGDPCAGCGWCRQRYAAAMAHRHPSKVRYSPLQW